MTETNPLLDAWHTPFGIPPFDSIRPEHFAPAFAAAMAEHLAEIAAIGADPAAPDFANTIEALQRSGRALTRIGSVFSNLVASLGGDPLEAVERDMSPLLAQHGMRVALDPAVFARVDALHARRDALALAEDQRRLLDRTHLGFVRSGAALDAPARERLTAISERLAVLHTAFGQNVVHDEKDWHLALSEADLDGLPGFVRDGAAQAAAELGVQGHAVTLSRSLIEPFLTFSARRDLRQTAFQAWIARGTHPGPHDNRTLVPEILALRRERAALLGYASFADFRLADTMAGDTHAVDRLLAEVWEPAKARAAAEREPPACRRPHHRLQRRAGALGLALLRREAAQGATTILMRAEIMPYFQLENMHPAGLVRYGARVCSVWLSKLISDAPGLSP